jgi:hypothetical protein
MHAARYAAASSATQVSAQGHAMADSRENGARSPSAEADRDQPAHAATRSPFMD